MEENGKTLKRREWFRTKNGIVFTSKNGKIWQIDYPNSSEKDHRYGGDTTAEKVAKFFILLGKGHSLEEADRIAFEKTK